MRVSSTQFYQQSIKGMMQRQADAAHTQMQLSAGKRILQPSDDPVGAVRAQALQRASAALDQFQLNGQQAQNRLQVEEAAITNGVNTLQNIRELVVQAGSGVQSDATRKAIAADIRQQLGGLLQIANSQDGAGRHLFGGYDEMQTPFVDQGGGNYAYQGDSGQRQLSIGPGRQIADGDPGDAVFMNVPPGSGLQTVSNPPARNIFAMVDAVASALENPGAELGKQLANGVIDMDSALDRLSDIRTQIGSRLNAVAQQSDINASAIQQFKETLSSIQDLDYASAITSYNQQMVGLQAAQQAYAKVQGLSLFDYIR